MPQTLAIIGGIFWCVAAYATGEPAHDAAAAAYVSAMLIMWHMDSRN